MTFRPDTTSTTSGTFTGTATSTHYSQEDWSTRARFAVWAVRSGREIRAAAAGVGRRVADTVTPLGWLCLAALVVLLPVGLLLGWVEFTVAGVLAAVVLLIALPFLLGSLAYRVDFELPVDRVVAGGEVVGSLKVTNASRRLELPGRIDVPVGKGLAEVWLPLLRPGHAHSEKVVVPAYRRGIIDVGPATTVRTDPLGVLKREARWDEVHRLFVHPRTVAIPSTSSGFVRDLEGMATHDTVDDDISFHQIREYAPGDGQRHIHWKSTAKTGSLMVRQFEESRRSRLAVVLGLAEAEFGDDEEFELAVSVAGSLGVRAVRDGRDVAVVASEQILDVAKGSVRAIRSLGVVTPTALLDDLSTVERTPYAMPLEEVCALATRAMNDLSIVFVLCGSIVDRHRLQQLKLRFPAGVQLVAVVADPTAQPGYRRLGEIGVMTVALLDDFRAVMRKAAL